MTSITLISTVHSEMGKCNADELHKIIKNIGPEVIFLEALNDTYSSYEKSNFSSFGVFHKKLEIRAIQKYSREASFAYVPVLDIGLSDTFVKKYQVVCENIKLQKLIDNFNSLAAEYGFRFLNSLESIKLQEEMRILEKHLLNDSSIEKSTSEDINSYESSMIRNIYSYFRSNHFSSAIFMVGVAHRKSIIEKIEKYNDQEGSELKWTHFES